MHLKFLLALNLQKFVLANFYASFTEIYAKHFANFKTCES